MTTCTECGTSPAPHDTISGRSLCAGCHRRLAEITGAVVSLGAGDSAAGAVGTGIATGGFHDAVEGERSAAAARRAKLAATEGFWNRLRVRVVG
ncbi:hypothetical protein ASD11_02595 [Aeromicrobium sp. Root495]|uniref:hypothetical protein n=1 Tax=Aeromicrobium sp. Root495 TaxID=1736550 RepID=UPI000700A440|nr:hypothetical protein [Aeromicrobium sp. Root495]KQY58568.1 hypothetical protein ASD11_02595 [Aeromicrobium sp. Root495]RYJ04719.1 MAG: hypothetical protein EON52_15325 [Actinomycetales bacterium]